jgi:pyruvate/2-oxoglutarate dehydrogenase complex dihydrolipoamide dehydrogenase (E3) component
VFAAGDVVTGPNTIIDAVAAGKRAAAMILRHLRGQPLEPPVESCRPSVYVEPLPAEGDDLPAAERVETPRASVEWRKRNFSEVEVTLSPEEARREASRCLRCDLEFTAPEEHDVATVGG